MSKFKAEFDIEASVPIDDSEHDAAQSIKLKLTDALRQMWPRIAVHTVEARVRIVAIDPPESET